MRYLLFFAIAYFIYKTIRRLVNDLQIRVANSEEVKGGEGDSHPKLQVDEADIEDAEFKDLE